MARLHELEAPRLVAGASAPQRDKEWARRKASIFWAPMPESFNFEDKFSTLSIITEAADEGNQP